jgi:hypothetical protein
MKEERDGKSRNTNCNPHLVPDLQKGSPPRYAQTFAATIETTAGHHVRCYPIVKNFVTRNSPILYGVACSPCEVGRYAQAHRAEGTIFVAF